MPTLYTDLVSFNMLELQAEFPSSMSLSSESFIVTCCQVF